MRTLKPALMPESQRIQLEGKLPIGTEDLPATLPMEGQESSQCKNPKRGSKDPILSGRSIGQKPSLVQENEEFRERLRRFMNHSTLSKESRNSSRRSKRGDTPCKEDRRLRKDGSQLYSESCRHDKSIDDSDKKMKKNHPSVSPLSGSSNSKDKGNSGKAPQKDDLSRARGKTLGFSRGGPALLEVPSPIEIVSRSKMQERISMKQDADSFRGSEFESVERYQRGPISLYTKANTTKEASIPVDCSQISNASIIEAQKKGFLPAQLSEGDRGNRALCSPRKLSVSQYQELSSSILMAESKRTHKMLNTEVLDSEPRSKESMDESIASVFKSISNK